VGSRAEGRNGHRRGNAPLIRGVGSVQPRCHRLLDDLIRPLQQRRRNRQAEGLGGLEVHDKQQEAHVGEERVAEARH